MNRELKFRFHCPGHGITKGYTLHELLTGHDVITSDGTNIIGSIRKDPMIITMQFTGLNDKEGKEIYEGDVVKILYTDWPSCWGCHTSTEEHKNAIALIRVVIWSLNGFYLSHEIGGYAESMEPGRHGFIEVIGNIHENPELLKS